MLLRGPNQSHMHDGVSIVQHSAARVGVAGATDLARPQRSACPL